MRISCPNCGSLLIYRSRKEGILEHVLSKSIFVHPFRCEGCDSRFFRWSLHEKPIPPRLAKTPLAQVMLHLVNRGHAWWRGQVIPVGTDRKQAHHTESEYRREGYPMPNQLVQ
jgi:hypothetical protein